MARFAAADLIEFPIVGSCNGHGSRPFPCSKSRSDPLFATRSEGAAWVVVQVLRRAVPFDRDPCGRALSNAVVERMLYGNTAENVGEGGAVQPQLTM